MDEGSPAMGRSAYTSQLTAAWAQSVVRLSDAALKEKLSFAMDGVILAMPPGAQTGRWNYCKHGTEFMWRKPSESFQPDLAGDDAYACGGPGQ